MNARAILGLSIALVAGACARQQVAPRDEIKFSHGDHLGGEFSCLGCHPAAVEDAGPEAPLVPLERTCRECHTAPAEQRCSFCHTAPGDPKTYARRGRTVRFDHRMHDEPMEGDCVKCHSSRSDTSSLANFEVHLPDMDTCTAECHSAEMRQLRCTPCHIDLHQYEIEEVVSFRHPPSFLREHAVPARTDQGLCTSCHEPSFCEDCHMEATPPIPLELIEATNPIRHFVHRGDFRSRHPLEARMDPGTCGRCHGVSYCDDCHRESGVGGSAAPGSPHPPGWLDPASPRGHAAEARRDIVACASCHESDAETTCVPCHRVGGVAQNPHPPGFASGLDPERHGVCRVCHVP